MLDGLGMSTKILLLATAAAAATSLASCGSDAPKSGAGTSSAATGTAAKIAVPKALRDRGQLTIASDATYPPIEFLAADGQTVRGLDADLSEAIGKKLGVRVRVVNAPFDGILPGLAAGKYDLGVSGFTDTREREKTVDFVTYFSAGSSFFVRAGGPARLTLKGLCGSTVAVQKGTVQADDAAAQDRTCRRDGDPGVTVLRFPDQPAANLALASKRADVAIADSPVAAYAVKRSGGRFALSGTSYGTAPYGIAIPKRAGMAEPIRRALEALMRDGTYRSILGRWGLETGAITTPTINGAAG